MAVTCQLPLPRPICSGVHAHVAAPLLSAVFAGRAIDRLPLVKIIWQVAPGVVLHMEFICVSELASYRLTKVPEGALKVLVLVLICAGAFGLLLCLGAEDVPEVFELALAGLLGKPFFTFVAVINTFFCSGQRFNVIASTAYMATAAKTASAAIFLLKLNFLCIFVITNYVNYSLQ